MGLRGKGRPRSFTMGDPMGRIAFLWAVAFGISLAEVAARTL